jgi:hypothetical protein
MAPDDTIVKASLHDLSHAIGIRSQFRGEGWHKMDGDTVLVRKIDDVWYAYVWYKYDPRPEIEKCLKLPLHG